MISSKKIKSLAEISHGDVNFQTHILKILADIMKRLESLEERMQYKVDYDS